MPSAELLLAVTLLNWVLIVVPLALIRMPDKPRMLAVPLEFAVTLASLRFRAAAAGGLRLEITMPLPLALLSNVEGAVRPGPGAFSGRMPSRFVASPLPDPVTLTLLMSKFEIGSNRPLTGLKFEMP